MQNELGQQKENTKPVDWGRLNEISIVKCSKFGWFRHFIQKLHCLTTLLAWVDHFWWMTIWRWRKNYDMGRVENLWFQFLRAYQILLMMSKCKQPFLLIHMAKTEGHGHICFKYKYKFSPSRRRRRRKQFISTITAIICTSGFFEKFNILLFRFKYFVFDSPLQRPSAKCEGQPYLSKNIKIDEQKGEAKTCQLKSTGTVEKIHIPVFISVSLDWIFQY